MNIFIYEHICGGGFADQDLPDVLRQEGWAMLSHIIADFADLPETSVTTCLDRRFAAESLPADITRVDTADQCQTRFDQLTAAADWTLVIAPEFDDILYRLTLRVEQIGKRLLGSTPQAVRLGADKYALAAHWTRRDIPTIPTRLIHLDPRDINPAELPAVLKPRDGAGSVQTYLIHDTQELETILATAADEKRIDSAILQPYIEGDPISMSFLVGREQMISMPCTRQFLTDDGRFAYLGGEGPLEGPDIDAARDVARRAIQSVEGLSGYVGVDLILTPTGPIVVELNPRLSTSYVGLRRLCKSNLAQAMINVIMGRYTEPLEWRHDRIRFGTDELAIRP